MREAGRCMASSLERAFEVREHVGDTLHMTDFPFAVPHLEQLVVGGRHWSDRRAARGRSGRATLQSTSNPLPCCHGRLPSQVGNVGTTRPPPFAGPGWSKA